MKTRFNKLTAWLLTLAMLMTLLPGFTLTASAAEEYELWVGGVRVTSDNKDGITGEGMTGTATYDPDSKTLTLADYNYEGPGYSFFDYSAAIYSHDTLNLVLEGESNVTHTGNASGYSCGVLSDGSITVSGKGSLTATGGTATTNSYGVFTSGITVFGNGILYGEGGEATHSVGVVAQTSNNNITVSGNGKLTGNGGKGTDSSEGVQTNGSITVSDNGSLNGNSGEAESSYGVSVYDSIIVEGDGSLNGMGGTTTNGSSYGVIVRYGNVTISNNGSLSGIGDKASSSYGVYVDNGSITISDSGSLNGKGGEDTEYSYGVFARNYITVKSGNLTGKGGEASYGSYGVYIGNDITVESGNLTGISSVSEVSSGVITNNGSVKVNGGSLKAVSNEEAGNSYGVVAWGTTINGGEVVAQGKNGAFDYDVTIADDLVVYDADGNIIENPVWYGTGALTYARIAEKACASVTTAGGETTYYTDFNSAINAAQNSGGSTLKLLDNINASVTINGGKFTIDLNGKTWQNKSDVIELTGNTQVKIIDSTPEGKGKMLKTSTEDWGVIALWDSSVLTLESGTLESSTSDEAITLNPNGHVAQAQFFMTGGTLKTNGTVAITAAGNSITISGGTIVGEIPYTGGVLDLSGHRDPTDILIYTDGGKSGEIVIKLPEGYVLLDRNDYTVVTEPIWGCDYTVGKCDHGGENATYDNGICTICGYVCEHNTFENDKCTVCGTVLGNKIVKYNEAAKSATVTVKEAGTYTLIFAKYGEGNRLDKVDVVEFDFKKGENTVPQEIKDFTLDTGDKIMLWQDMINLVPLCEAYIVK